MQVFFIAITCSFTVFLSGVLTYYYRRWAFYLGIVDKPNGRSSHKRATPRGAGVAFFISTNIALAILVLLDLLSLNYTLPVFLGGPVVMIMGYWDDIKSVNPFLRLFVHFIVSVFIFSLLSAGFTRVVDISFLPLWPWLTATFCILFIAWFINLYNFMDGCDGLAAGVGMVGAGLIAIISYVYGFNDLSIIYLIIAYSLAGFLLFNWSPARVFMGDSGAYFLGYVFGALALVSKMYYETSLYVHLIIFGMLIVDSTWTLLRRLFRGEKVYLPHRLHGFQKLIDRGWGHARVTSIYILVTILWLFPMALLSMSYKEYSFLFLVLSYVPPFLALLYVGAGGYSK